MKRMLGEPQSRSERFIEAKNLLHLLGNKPRAVQSIACSLYWLRYSGFLVIPNIWFYTEKQDRVILEEEIESL